MLAEILAELLARASRKHHVRHHQINPTLALFINLHRLLRVLGRQNFKARAFQDAASRLTHKRLVLNQEDGSPTWPIVREYVGLKSHTILDSLSRQLFFQQSHGPAVFANSARAAPTSPFVRTLLRRGKNRLLRIKHNLPNAARRDQPKPSLRAIRQHFAQKNQPVSRRRRIHRNRRHQVIGYVLLYDHACNRGHPSLLRDANLPRFQLWYRRPFNPTFQEPIQLGTFLVPEWTRQFLFENLHQFTRAYGLARIPLPDFPQPAEERLF